MVKFSQLKEIMGGKILAFSQDVDVNELCIDSRKAGISAGTLFFAIHGERHDGHDYLLELHASGIRQFVVEVEDVDVKGLQGSNIIAVGSSTLALQQLAAFNRRLFHIAVVGITGSNGKTITKEWLSQMLSIDKIVAKNPGSYNSQVGVPLAVWQLQSHHQVGIFEAGISRPGEMEKLERIIRPTVGIFTNIGPAHDEGFADREQKIAEKLKLFAHCDGVVYCSDHVEVHRAISRTTLKTFTWGSTDADISVRYEGKKLHLNYKKTEHTLHIEFTDAASRENILHCLATLIFMNHKLDDLQHRVKGLRSVSMRMELKESINRCLVIDDTYNNDLGGLEIALQLLTNLQQKKRKRIILSDILESGLADDTLVENIVSLIHRHEIVSIVGIGAVMSNYKSLFPKGSEFFTTTQEFLDHFDFNVLQDEAILVKGARKFTFERIVARLQRKVHGTVMEIDLDSLIFNLNYFKSRLNPETKIMVMVKAFAYGSGSTEIANLLQYHRADYLGVAYADEGIELRKNNITLPVMVMNPSEESFESLLAYDLEPEVYSLRIFETLLAYLEGKACKIHIKIDTGMHRLGFEIGKLDSLIKLLRANPAIRVVSIFSHLAGADERDHDNFSGEQYNGFLQAADSITEVLGYRPLYHILNTPGILRLPQYQLDMVRLGIGLYGVDPTVKGLHPLRPVATLKTIISQIKFVHRGESIGYGRRGLAERDITIATLAIGYADGFSRAFSRGVGEVLVNGSKAKVIGNVCMDMTMIDITGIQASEGDEAVIFGKELPIQELAENAQTIPYEILTGTSERVKRVFISGGI